MASELAIVAKEAQDLLGRNHPEFAALIQEAIKNGVKITIDEVLRIWRATQKENIPGLTHSIIWVEEGTDKAGYQHFLKHEAEFAQLGVPRQKLAELAEAATTVGVPGGKQGKKSAGRPIFGLFFHDKPIAVAISVGSNGFVVGMNPSNLDKCIKAAGIKIEELQEMHHWTA